MPRAAPPSGINNAIRQLMADVKADSDEQDTAISNAQTTADEAKATADGKVSKSGDTMTGALLWEHGGNLWGEGDMYQSMHGPGVHPGYVTAYAQGQGSCPGGAEIVARNSEGTPIHSVQAKQEGCLADGQKITTFDGAGHIAFPNGAQIWVE